MSATLASMTGYARVSAQIAQIAFQIEVKSVNGRGLDLRLRLAQGFDRLEPKLRRKLSEALTRGSISLTLNAQRTGGAGALSVNQEALDTLLDTLVAVNEKMRRKGFALRPARPRMETILSLPGVLSHHEQPPDAAEAEIIETAILVAADKAIGELKSAQIAEGKQLAVLVAARLDEIAVLLSQAEKHPAASRERIQARLRQQVAELLEAGNNLSEERLYQEAMLLATKADIREELDRLGVHVVAARALLAKGGAVGRRLDFLAQEFNREANTLCAKSNAAELTAIGLELKAIIDQLREQVQNIE